MPAPSWPCLEGARPEPLVNWAVVMDSAWPRCAAIWLLRTAAGINLTRNVSILFVPTLDRMGQAKVKNVVC